MRTILSGFMLLGLLGCGDLSSTDNTEESPLQQSENQVSSDSDSGSDADEQEQQRDTQGKKSIIHRKTREILNANEAIKDPNLGFVKLDVHGNDPLTQAASVYGKAAAFAGTLGIKQWINIEKALNGQPPTYVQLQAWMEKNPNVKLPVLPYKRMYGYDETTGEIVILEKRDEQ